MAAIDLEKCGWQYDIANISERCEYLLKHEQWTDCLFLVEPESKPFRAHKLILGMSSSVFGAMFYGKLAEKDEPILIPDVQSAVFEKLLDFIYCDRFDEEEVDLAFDLCYAAQKYMLPVLVEKCSKFIRYKMSPSIACKSYEFAKLIDNPELLQQSLCTICDEMDKILAGPSIENIALDTWLDILDSDELGYTTECDLMKALDKWAVKECGRKELEVTQKNLRSVIGPALKKIRFLSLTAVEFADGPANSPTLLDEEIAAILVNQCSSRRSRPMPSGFSMITQPRGKLKPFLHNWCEGSSMSTTYNVGYASWTMQFSAGRKALIYGFKVTAFSDQHVTWNKFMTASLYDFQNKLIASMSNNEPVPKSNRDTLIKWDSVVTVLPNQIYKIEVSFHGYAGFIVQHIPRSKPSIMKKNYAEFTLKPVGDSGTVVQSILFSIP